MTNWIIDYTNAANTMNESPVNYNMWSAISAVAAALKNNVWLERGNYKLYPNQYIVLVGPAGVGKGTAIKPAHRFVKDPSTNVPLANYIEDRITAPKLIEVLATGFPVVHFSNGSLINGKDSTCVLHAEELSTLLNANDWISDFLTKTWEGGEFVYSTKSGNKQLAKGLCPSLIGACTPGFIKTINKNHGAEVSNGFTARTIFVHGSEHSKIIPFPDGFKQQYPQLAAKLDTDIQTVARLGGEYVFSATARDIFESKYYEIRKSTVEEDSEVMKNFKSRQPIHILKVAMVFAAARSDDLVIDDYAMTSAIALIDTVVLTLDKIFSGVGDSELAESLDRIGKYMESKGEASRSDILRDNRRNITPDHMDVVLYILEESGILSSCTRSGKKFFKFLAGATP